MKIKRQHIALDCVAFRKSGNVSVSFSYLSVSIVTTTTTITTTTPMGG